jgi:glycosyltransferase involved in cell wall biosynthesis
MRILMLGWEFPPHISGGLGTACQGLVRALGRLQVETTFVLPDATGATATSAAPSSPGSSFPVDTDGVRLLRAPAELPSPYPGMPGPRMTASSASGHRGPDSDRTDLPMPSVLEREGRVQVVSAGVAGGYGGDLAGRINAYARHCERLANDIEFDVVHAHDWMTFPAGIAIARAFGRPLVVHVHATEFDRSGPFRDPVALGIEREGLLSAARIIVVSAYTRRVVMEQHGIPVERITVIHNGIEPRPATSRPAPGRRRRTVLFLGRITRQKGPFVFVKAAAMLAGRIPDIRFLVVGWGDLGPAMVEAAAIAGLGSRMRFTGFLRGPDVDRAYRAAGVYAMPSLSEPFGLTALEAAGHGVPVVASRRSGVVEVLREGSLPADPDDPEDLADRLAAVLRRRPLADQLRERAIEETATATWDRAARACLKACSEVQP